jgi:hypothetical protein
MTTTANPTDIADVVQELRHRLGGGTPQASAQEAPGCWPAEPAVTGERSVARHAKDKDTVARWTAELRRPQVAVPVAVAVAAAGVGIGLAVRR